MVAPSSDPAYRAAHDNGLQFPASRLPRHSHASSGSIEVHELPRVGQRRSGGAPASGDVILKPGMIFTVEPGAYVPGTGGVRVEDDVLVTTDGFEMLTEAPRGLSVG